LNVYKIKIKASCTNIQEFGVSKIFVLLRFLKLN